MWWCTPHWAHHHLASLPSTARFDPSTSPGKSTRRDNWPPARTTCSPCIALTLFLSRYTKSPLFMFVCLYTLCVVPVLCKCMPSQNNKRTVCTPRTYINTKNDLNKNFIRLYIYYKISQSFCVYILNRILLTQFDYKIFSFIITVTHYNKAYWSFHM